jgi:hypothetical protein
VLLMLMAVVLDGGLLLVRRREAQASADAGVLRGVLYICGNSVTAEAGETARAEGISYATVENQATSAAASVNIAINQLTVIATITQKPALAGLMGWGPIDVSASATAQCQNAGVGTSLMPFVFACEPPEGVLVEDYPDCVQKIAEDPDEPIFPDEYYIVHNSNPEDENLWCIDPPNSEFPDEFEGNWDCDFDNDGVDDIIDSGDKGWISLQAGTNPGTNELIDWIANGFDGEISTHMWAGGSPGVSNSIFQSIAELADPDFPVVYIPIFDAVCNFSGDPEIECPGKWHDSSIPPDITLTIGGAQKYYHISAFAAFQITCVHAPPATGCPYRAYVNGLWTGGNPFPLTADGLPTSIEGYFIGIVDADFGSGGTIDTGVYIAKLTN